MDSLVKYPRTPHLPWSPGIQNDDTIIESLKHFQNQSVVITEKMDGENTTMYRDYYHARSVDSKNHPSRNMVKNLHGQIKHEIPEGWRVCGENLYARHSIMYENLPSYFMLFSIWNEKNECLSWNETIEWCRLLNLIHVPVLYCGVWDEEKIRQIDIGSSEGYVVRLAEKFAFGLFKYSVAKYVRKNHIQTDKHWMRTWNEEKINKLGESL